MERLASEAAIALVMAGFKQFLEISKRNVNFLVIGLSNNFDVTGFVHLTPP